MAAQTPQFSLSLEFDEQALQRLLRSFDQSGGTQVNVKPRAGALVPLHCTLRDSSGSICKQFVVDAAHVPVSRLEHIDNSDCCERTFYYLNGLLNALRRVHLWRCTGVAGSVKALRIETKSLYLRHNAQVKRVARWKKVGYKRADGEPVRLRELWNEFYAWCTGPLRFDPLTVAAREAT